MSVSVRGGSGGRPGTPGSADGDTSLCLCLSGEGAVAVLGHQGLLTVTRATVGVQGGGTSTIALMAAPVMPRAAGLSTAAHQLQPTAYHVARGEYSQRP